MDASNLYRFSGRSGRLGFALIQIGVATTAYVLVFLAIVLTGAGDEAGSGVTVWNNVWVALGGAVVVINLVWISLAAAVRRCHDRNLSGWMLLFAMPPVLGQLWLFLSLLTGPGTRGPNRHGRRRQLYVETTSRRPTLPVSAALA